ncbi:MAG: PhoH family protein [Elusimicrobia bacterium]|nr:PhoH family protein [Elusimicrobiota bacterium]
MALFGHDDRNLELLEKRFKVHAYIKREQATGDIALILRGSKKKIDKATEYLSNITQPEYVAGNAKIPMEYALETNHRKTIEIPGSIITTYANKTIIPQTPNQAAYIRAIEENDIVVSIGPAGTGKTYLAVAYALRCLKNQQVSRIVLTRPVVEAGEKLGFLPGDLYEKLYPYLKPLYDALFVMLGAEKFKALQTTETIEIIPLAYMRGRTIDNAFIILDEAQNTTMGQMKMFLTRMGAGSKIVVTGDVTQIDLENKNLSGLRMLEEILEGTPGLRFVHLTEADVVRHHIVKRIIRAFEDWESRASK